MPNNTDQTYEIYTPDGFLLKVDKNTDEILNFAKNTKPTGKYTQRYSQAVLEAWQIMENSPYKDYKPIYLDPDDKSTLKKFKKIQAMYYHPPKKGAIAPWTKEEKAYYESLKTKAQRYKYLVIRSGLKSTVIDIPDDAIACADDEAKLKKYKHLFDIVSASSGMAYLGYGYLPMSEWNLAAGMLGNIDGFIDATHLFNTGFKARAMQIYLLYIQLGGNIKMLPQIYENGKYFNFALGYGLKGDLIKADILKEFIKNPPYDEFGMLPYLDELIGVDWILDCNYYNLSSDPLDKALRAMSEKITKGEFLDPRDERATPEDRLKFMDEYLAYANGATSNYCLDIPSEWDEKNVTMHIMYLFIEAKLAALTPPQGYPNAPTYEAPEILEKWYHMKEFDILESDKSIPAIDRYNFPQYLRDEIYAHARKIGLR